MGNKLYVGNLSFRMSESELSEEFSSQGTVKSARIITDRETGRSRGFGFVEMENSDEAEKCVETMDGKDIGGRQIKVSIAKERTGGTRPNNRR